MIKILTSRRITVSFTAAVSILVSITTLMFYANASAQVQIAWEANYKSPYVGSSYATAIAVDTVGNIYITGESAGTGDYQDWVDYATVKYDASGNELWAARYNGPAQREDIPKGIAVDQAGNVYVSGISFDGNHYLDATIKYDTNGNELWIAKFGSPPVAQAVDASGNVVVAGSTYSNETSENYTTVKTDTSGNQLWIATYNSPDNGSDNPMAIAMDYLGNVYVTGYSARRLEYGATDCITLKYDTNGNALWAANYRGPGIGCAPAALNVDAAGNVYVAATSSDSDRFSDFLTIKYDTDGNELWAVLYNGPRNGQENAVALALDANGNVYVTGNSVGAGTYTDYATVKYDTNGNQLWVSRYEGIDYDYAKGLSVDGAGNVYVTGTSQGTREPNHYTGLDGLTIKYDTVGNELWVVRSPGFTPGSKVPIAVDINGYVYLTGGITPAGESQEYLTIKLIPVNDTGDAGDSGGGPRDTGPSTYTAHAFGMDSEGSFYITGSISPESTRWSDWITVKYDGDGNELWEVRHDGPVHEGDSAALIAFDGTDVYVGGYITSIYGTDYGIVKYDKNGNEIWRNSYTEPVSTSSDSPSSIGVDSERNVYLNGNAGLIKFDKEGNRLWVRKGVPSKHLAIDASCNLFVSGDNFNTAKYDKDGNQLWLVTNKPTPPPDEEYPDEWSITAMAIDSAGSVYVTGYSGVHRYVDSGDRSTCRTIKYDSNGNLQWMAVYTGSYGRAWPQALDLDSQGSVIVALRNGATWNAYDNNWDYMTVKYDSRGNLLWSAQYSGPGDPAVDSPVALRIDRSDNIYVTGLSAGSETQFDFATVKYDPSGNELWVNRWDGPTSGSDFPVGLLINQNGNVYAGGVRDGWSDGWSLDYSGPSFVIVKFSAETGRDETISGDASGGGGCFIMCAANSLY